MDETKGDIALEKLALIHLLNSFSEDQSPKRKWPEQKNKIIALLSADETNYEELFLSFNRVERAAGSAEWQKAAYKITEFAYNRMSEKNLRTASSLAYLAMEMETDLPSAAKSLASILQNFETGKLNDSEAGEYLSDAYAVAAQIHEQTGVTEQAVNYARKALQAYASNSSDARLVVMFGGVNEEPAKEPEFKSGLQFCRDLLKKNGAAQTGLEMGPGGTR